MNVMKQRNLQRRTWHSQQRATAYCEVCHPDQRGWYSRNAQAVAARHTDATGHTTHVETILWITYESTANEER